MRGPQGQRVHMKMEEVASDMQLREEIDSYRESQLFV